MAQNQENDKTNLKLLTRKSGGRSYIKFKPNKKEHQKSFSQKMQESKNAEYFRNIVNATNKPTRD